MEAVARLPTREREVLFNEAGARLGLANAIVEKDFWVCWTLKRLFGAAQARGDPTLVFKGGTSLSKAYGAIRRFSEDIDLSFDRAGLGYAGGRDPEAAGSRKRADELIAALVADVARHVAVAVLPRLTDAIEAELGPAEGVDWRLAIDEADAQTINFRYPSSLGDDDYAGLAYISPRVRLEFGARGDPWPTERRRIRPYAADEFPDYFADPECEVSVLSAERTFWEKATALHAEHHRPAATPTPRYISRHYYDLVVLADTEWGRRAMEDLELLGQVARHKRVFFRSGWARYEEARAGTLRLLPVPGRVPDLRSDYRAMAPMLFDDPPPRFEALLDRLGVVERTVNGAALDVGSTR